jgi:hypothetical protein
MFYTYSPIAVPSIPTESAEELKVITEEGLPETDEKMASIAALEGNFKTAEILRHKVKAGLY